MPTRHSRWLRPTNLTLTMLRFCARWVRHMTMKASRRCRNPISAGHISCNRMIPTTEAALRGRCPTKVVLKRPWTSVPSCTRNSKTTGISVARMSIYCSTTSRRVVVRCPTVRICTSPRNSWPTLRNALLRLIPSVYLTTTATSPCVSGSHRTGHTWRSAPVAVSRGKVSGSMFDCSASGSSRGAY